jgi:hypothetical protein
MRYSFGVSRQYAGVPPGTRECARWFVDEWRRTQGDTLIFLGCSGIFWWLLIG